MPTKFLWRPWGIRTGQIRNGAFSVRKTAEKAGRKYCFMMKTRAGLIWPSSRGIRRRFLLRFGKREGRRGAFTHLRMDRGAGCMARRMAAIIGNIWSAAEFRQKDSGGSGLLLRPAIRGVFI